MHHDICDRDMVAEQELAAALAEFLLQQVQVLLHVLRHALFDHLRRILVVATEPAHVENTNRVRHIRALGGMDPAKSCCPLCYVGGKQLV